MRDVVAALIGMLLIFLLLLGLTLGVSEENTAAQPSPGFNLLFIDAKERELTFLDNSKCPFQWGPIPWLMNIQHTDSGYEFMRTFYVNGGVYAEAKTEGYVVPAECGPAYE